MYCAKCGKQLEDDAAFCSQCGWKVGSPIVNDAGAAQAAPQYQQPIVNVVNSNTNKNTIVGYGYIPKKKWVAFFLCLFLGGLGIHRFYVGKTGTGIIWMLTFGLFGIGWFIDLLLILFGGFRDKASQPLV